MKLLMTSYSISIHPHLTPHTSRGKTSLCFSFADKLLLKLDSGTFSLSPSLGLNPPSKPPLLCLGKGEFVNTVGKWVWFNPNRIDL